MYVCMCVCVCVRMSDDQDRYVLFFVYWALKESYIKATGEGITVDLQQVHICIYIYIYVFIYVGVRFR